MQANRCCKLIRHARFIILLVCVGTLGLTGILEGQQKKQVTLPQPTINYIMPMGGKIGTEVELLLTGADLEESTGLLLDHPGLKAEKVPDPPPPPVDPKKPAPKGMPAQSPANTAAKYKISVAPNTPLGIHDVRIINKYGLSNPRAFVVGDQNEVVEKEPNNDIPDALKIEINTTVNGVINAPTDVDYVVFNGKKGQRVILSCLAASIDSRLNPVVELYNAAGQRLATNRNYNDTDAVSDVVLPADGDYFVRVFQFTHVAGNAEYFYRLTISTTPWIDAVYPPMVEPGKATPVTLYGRNLPGGQLDPSATYGTTVLEKATVTITAPTDPQAKQRLTYSGYLAPVGSGTDGFEYRVKNGSGSSNPVLLGLAQGPVVLDNGKNVTRETAQEVNVPCEIAGRFDKNRIQGWYIFEAKENAAYTIEVLSDRLGSPTDLAVSVYSLDGKQTLVELDDDPEVLSNQFFTRTSDPPRYRFQRPAGKYVLLVRNQGSMGGVGPRTFYRVRIAPEQPDFRLVAMPPSAVEPEGALLFQGGNQEYAVHVFRQDGFTGPITLSVENLPSGVTCKPQVVSTGMKGGNLVVSAADNAPAWTGEIKIKGKATINGQEVVREARSASLVWGIALQQNQQPFAVLSRLDRGSMLAVREKAPFALNATAEQITVQQGTKVKIPMKIARNWPEAKVPINVVIANLPAGIVFNGKNAPLAIAADKNEMTLEIDIDAKANPGVYAIVFRGTSQIPYAKDPKAAKNPVNITQPSTQVVVKLLPKTVANLTVNQPPALKLGASTEVVVKVQRLYDFAGEFKVELVDGGAITKGISVPAVSIPAGKDEAKLMVSVAPDAAPGNRAGVTFKATAMIDDKIPAVHEAKVNLNVTK